MRFSPQNAVEPYTICGNDTVLGIYFQRNKYNFTDFFCDAHIAVYIVTKQIKAVIKCKALKYLFLKFHKVDETPSFGIYQQLTSQNLTPWMRPQQATIKILQISECRGKPAGNKKQSTRMSFWHTALCVVKSITSWTAEDLSYLL